MSGTRSASRIRVVVIGGGQNCEHEVSLATAAGVASGLDPRRYDVLALTIDPTGRWRDSRGELLPGGIGEAMSVLSAADVIFPAVHGPNGEDGTLAGLCELAGVPYVGSGVRAGALAMDKWITKLIAAELGLATAPGVVVTASSPASATDALAPPLVVKPVAAGSSYGITLVDHRDALAAAIETALEHDSRALVETLVRGREIDIAVLERADGSRLVGPPLEIVVGAGALFGTDEKYDGSADFRVPADVTDAEHDELRAAALEMFDALGCAGFARFDFFVVDGHVVLNEVNTMPGMTAESQVPKMYAAIGLPYGQLLDELVGAALRRSSADEAASTRLH